MEKSETFNIHKLEHQELVSSKDGETLSKSLSLTRFLNFKDLFVHHEILAPGLRASSPHVHTQRKEMIFILTGSPTVHIGNRTIQLNPGDFLGFIPGASELHFVENNTQEEVRFLVICSNPEKDETIYT